MASVVLNWTPAGGLVTSQKVYRGPDPGSLSLIATLSASANSYTDTGLVGDAQYFYMVQSICSIGGPEDSTVVSVTTQQAVAVNLLVIPNAPPQANSDNILQSQGTLGSIIQGGINPISSPWSVMGWFRMDHKVTELQQNNVEDIADTVLFAIEEDYDSIAQNPGSYDVGHLAIYREASSSGDYLTVELQDNNANKIRYQYLLSSGSNNNITGITGPFPAVYWDDTVAGNNGLIHIAVTYNPSASLVNRVTVYWNSQALTISSAPYNSPPSDSGWSSNSKRITLGWAAEISVGYSGHSLKTSVDELGFYDSVLNSTSVMNGYNNNVIEIQSNIPSLAPTLEWSFEEDGSENGGTAAADILFNNPPGVQPYGEGPYVFPANQPIPQ